MTIKPLHRVVFGLKHMICLDTSASNVQAFVYSYHDHLWYPQEQPDVNGCLEIVLGDGKLHTGKYKITAVACTEPLSWDPQALLPAGNQFNTLKVRRIGN